MIYIRQGTPCKRLKQYEDPNIESICFEIVVNKKKWVIFSIYRPPYDSNAQEFFQYMSISLDSAINKYDNVIVIGDININTKGDKGIKFELYNQF